MVLLNGIIVRKNKRNVYIQLTELGKITFLKWQAYLDEREDITLRDFSKEERKQFINYLERLYDALLKGGIRCSNNFLAILKTIKNIFI
mgnify:CR=1 FL=1